MKNIKSAILIILVIFTATCFVGCYRFKKIEVEDFIDTVQEIYGEELELKHCIGGYSEATNTTHGADGTSSSSLIYRIYDDEEDARLRFEEYCDEFQESQEENKDAVRIEISHNSGYIIFDDVSQVSSFSIYNSPAYVDEMHEVTDIYYNDARRFGCIYYYDSTIIVINSVEPFDTDIDSTIELLDALSLPHM